MTLYDVSLFEGPLYDNAVTHAGNGVGIAYTNWDKKSTTICDCSDGYFGPDCSLGI